MPANCKSYNVNYPFEAACKWSVPASACASIKIKGEHIVKVARCKNMDYMMSKIHFISQGLGKASDYNFYLSANMFAPASVTTGSLADTEGKPINGGKIVEINSMHYSANKEIFTETYAVKCKSGNLRSILESAKTFKDLNFKKQYSILEKGGGCRGTKV